MLLSKDMNATIAEALQNARAKRHEFLTLEHLLLALLDNTVAKDVLVNVGADQDGLRSALEEHIEKTTPLIPAGDGTQETQMTLGFQRVIRRGVLHVQSSGRKEMTGANALVAIFNEQESTAAYLLEQQDVERIDVVNYIAHGISKGHDDDENPERRGVDEAGGSEPQSTLQIFTSNLNATIMGALENASAKRHEFLTVEHLLLALLDNALAKDVLLNLGADLDGLRSALEEHIDKSTPLIPDRHPNQETQMTLGFQRVIRRGVFQAQSNGREETTAADALAAIFHEQDSTAASLLEQQNIDRIDVINHIGD